MIKAIDEMLKQWAAELHPPEGARVDLPGRGQNMIATLMATKGELIRGSRGSTCYWDRTADIELIVNKRLPPDLEHLVRVHYTDYDSPDSMKWEHCRCSRPQYYRRLNVAHASIAELLLLRKAA
ncbi:hypothetical protein VV867_12490 [Pseudomonas sp. JH-2]|uniref:PA0613 family protein n=1 Tax=Pseudomonas sp. JH-2 TaxID=3114998 RepID=UPI002E2670CD|nr:hypothetical protein [Pseudomonas sp. JH-2]